MYVVTDANGAVLSDLLTDRPTDEQCWRVWDTALVGNDLPAGNYPRVRKL